MPQEEIQSVSKFLLALINCLSFHNDIYAFNLGLAIVFAFHFYGFQLKKKLYELYMILLGYDPYILCMFTSHYDGVATHILQLC